MIRTISYAALALFIVSVPASVLAQNAPASDPATQPPAVALPDATLTWQKKTRQRLLMAKS